MKVNAIELVFENCETLVIYTKHIVRIGMGQEKRTLSRYANALSAGKSLDKFWVVLHKNTPNDNNVWTVAKRLGECDVTYVNFHYEDDSTEAFSLEWGEDDYPMYRSMNQRLQITPEGNIIFSTSKERIVFDEADLDSSARWLWDEGDIN